MMGIALHTVPDAASVVPLPTVAEPALRPLAPAGTAASPAGPDFAAFLAGILVDTGGEDSADGVETPAVSTAREVGGEAAPDIMPVVLPLPPAAMLAMQSLGGAGPSDPAPVERLPRAVDLLHAPPPPAVGWPPNAVGPAGEGQGLAGPSVELRAGEAPIPPATADVITDATVAAMRVAPAATASLTGAAADASFEPAMADRPQPDPVPPVLALAPITRPARRAFADGSDPRTEAVESVPAILPPPGPSTSARPAVADPSRPEAPPSPRAAAAMPALPPEPALVVASRAFGDIGVSVEGPLSALNVALTASQPQPQIGEQANRLADDLMTAGFGLGRLDVGTRDRDRRRPAAPLDTPDLVVPSFPEPGSRPAGRFA